MGTYTYAEQSTHPVECGLKKENCTICKESVSCKDMKLHWQQSCSGVELECVLCTCQLLRECTAEHTCVNALLEANKAQEVEIQKLTQELADLKDRYQGKAKQAP